MESVFKEIDAEIAQIQEHGICIDGVVEKFTFYLCADYKFLLTVCGMKAANSNNACVYCVAKKGDYHRSGGKARSGYRVGEPGVAHVSLLPSIPVERIVLDFLHLFLRTSDKILLTIRREVPEERVSEFVKMIQDQISCRGKIVAREGKVEFQNCDSADRRKIIHFLITSACLVILLGKTRGEALRLLLVKYVKMLGVLQTSGDPEAVQAACEAFMASFLSAFQTTMVTPYLHMVGSHCSEIVARVGCMNVFTQQHVEKLNHNVTAAYFRTTNFKDGKRQVLACRGRMLLQARDVPE